MTRYRLVEHANDSETGLLLCTVAGATEQGAETRPDDDLIVLYRPGMDTSRLVLWVETWRREGIEVEWDQGLA